MKKEPHGKWIINKVQIDPIEFDSFRLKTFNACVSLRAPISIDKSIQPLVIIGGIIVVVTNLVIDVPSGRESDGVESVEKIAVIYGSDG